MRIRLNQDGHDDARAAEKGMTLGEYRASVRNLRSDYREAFPYGPRPPYTLLPATVALLRMSMRKNGQAHKLELEPEDEAT